VRLVAELKRRNVIRMAVIYVVAAWLVMQVAEVVIGLANLPAATGPWILALLALGFPIALLVSWFYEITPEGLALERNVPEGESIRQATGRRIDLVVIAMLAAAVLLFAWDKWHPRAPVDLSIAVLPFENMSNDAEQEFFADGVTEEILNLLAQTNQLKVIARNSTWVYKGRNVDVATVADRLNVSHVLEGSVRRSANRVRITAQLIDASDSTHVWSQIYDRELGDVFAVQDEIATAISESLELRLLPGNGKTVVPKAIRTANMDAYDAYLKGRDYFRQRGKENARRAMGEFERAVRLDNDFAPAHAMLATVAAWRGGHDLSVDEAQRIAETHLEIAGSLAPDLAELHGGRALLAGLLGNPEAEVEHARKALAINPSYGDALHWLRSGLLQLRRYDEADALYDRTLSADPMDFILRVSYAGWLCETGRLEESRAVSERLLEDSPRMGHLSRASVSYFCLGDVAAGLASVLEIRQYRWAMFGLILVGEYDEARRFGGAQSFWVDAALGDWDEPIRVARQRLAAAPDNMEALIMAGGILFQAGHFDEARTLLDRALKLSPKGRPLPAAESLLMTLWLAEARRRTGDEAGAVAVADIVRTEIAALERHGRRYPILSLAKALLAAFDGDAEGAISALETAIDQGLRTPPLYSVDGPNFDAIRDQPGFVAVRHKLDEFMASDRRKVLELICLDNPAAEDWQPMPETCQGVTTN